MLVLKKAGALRNGREFSSRNPVWHAVDTADIYSCKPALCGASPRVQWTDSAQPREVTCIKCRIKLAGRAAMASKDVPAGEEG
jgi:hypothetical protein